jgi:hypothetical protein
MYVFLCLRTLRSRDGWMDGWMHAPPALAPPPHLKERRRVRAAPHAGEEVCGGRDREQRARVGRAERRFRARGQLRSPKGGGQWGE